MLSYGQAPSLMGRPNIYDVSWFWSTVLLMVLFCDVEVNGQLLPQSLGRPATNKKTFENGVGQCLTDLTTLYESSTVKYERPTVPMRSGPPKESSL
ncbi:hypothetical protein COOONC_24633, partial [Cooperia oncophora]